MKTLELLSKIMEKLDKIERRIDAMEESQNSTTNMLIETQKEAVAARSTIDNMIKLIKEV